MKEPVESLLEDDHDSLDELLTELEGELASPNMPRAFELLDLFWARLAVHIRAEHLQLFPALENATALFTGTNNLPTSSEVQAVLARLRSDHDFFMKQLSMMIKVMRKMTASERARPEDVGGLQQRLAAIRARLANHNRVEEQQVYVWPSLVFDERKVAGISECLKHELENLPPRFP